jgi:hypothetical protein
MLQSIFDAIPMLAASWNAVSQETAANCYWNAGFCKTPEPLNEENDDSEVHASEKMLRKR